MQVPTRSATLAALVAALVTLSGCGLVRGIFKAGMWTAVVLVVFAVLAVFGITRAVGRAR
jgi:hypothetical protein